MTASSTPPLHVLRGILRQLKKTSPSSSSSSSNTEPSSSLRHQILSQYRTSQNTPQPKADTLRIMAYEYLTLQTNLIERARLHELDAGADVKLSPRELSRRAAARAGLQLPELDRTNLSWDTLSTHTGLWRERYIITSFVWNGMQNHNRSRIVLMDCRGEKRNNNCKHTHTEERYNGESTT